MKNSLTVLIALCFSITLQSQTPANLTTADYARAESMLSYGTGPLVDRGNIRVIWLPDGKFWYRTFTPDGVEYVLIDPATGARKTAAKLEALVPDAGEERAPSRGRASRNEVVSPDGKKAVYIKDWNLWVRNLETQTETQLTSDGIENFGYATDNAGWRKGDGPVVLWSPDSKKIATFQQDQRHVSDMYLVSTNVGAPKLSAWKYPLPTDEKVIMIHRVIIDVDQNKVVRLNIPPDPRRGTLCDDIACSGSFDDNEWSSDSKKLAFVSSSRDHKIAKLQIADAATGQVSEVMTETVETQYESGQGGVCWRYLSDSDEFIWYSERDDWGHLYLYDSKGKLKNQITKGNFVVLDLQKVDTKNRQLYFEANGREAGENPYFTHFYRIDFSGNNLKLLTPEPGHHQVSLSPDEKYLVDAYSQPDVPTTTVLRDIQGKLIAALEKTDVSRLQKAGWKPPMPITVKSRDGRWDLYGLMFTPSQLDPNKKYPVVNYIYPGPQGGSVGSWAFSPSRGDHQALAELGFVVILIEGTCNPGRSKSFHDVCYGYMADNTLEDQMSGIRQLAQKHTYIDTSKVGIWGHSGGGFATAAAMFRYPDFYKVGISESGNHDNRNYEDDWGERYIGLLTKDSSGVSNYEEQANQNHAKNLKGKLMLVHGNMDDNVPPYNSYLVVDALVKANKDFDLVIFPNARHGFGQDSYYMTRRRWDYFVKNLMGATPPKEYELKPKQDPRVPRA